MSKNPRHVRTHCTGTWEVSMPSRCRGGIAKERETVTDDARHGEVRLGHSVCWAAFRSGGLKSHWRSGKGRHIQKWG